MEIFGDMNSTMLASRLRTARQRAALTQTQVALYADLNLGNYNEMEQGKRPGIRATTLYRLCQVLRISADYLLGLGEDLPGHLHYLPSAEGWYDGCCAACNEPAGRHVMGCVGATP